MKYMLMVLSKQSDYDLMAGRSGETPWTKEAVKAMVDYMGALNDDLAEAGELIDAQGLTEPAQAKLVTVKDGQVVVTDGPYGETKEEIAGYWLIDVDSEKRALEIAERAARCPIPAGVPDYPVVLRPVADAPPEPQDWPEATA
ncbi:MAG TPA: YciI family protein [Actinopolymorphaceae bacterium]|jgi:hypothetical protein